MGNIGADFSDAFDILTTYILDVLFLSVLLLLDITLIQ